MAFLHGIETIEVSDGVVTVNEVVTSVIGLVGIAPAGPKNTLTMVRTDADAAQFGKRLPGFNIPHALSHIRQQGSGTILVVNVFDEDLHTEEVEDEQHTVTGGVVTLAAAPLSDLVIKTSAGAATTYVEGTDYTLDDFGKLTVIKARIANGTVLKFTYTKLNADAVTDAHIIGGVDADSNRTGAKVLDLASSVYGYEARILLSPGYTSSLTVTDALLAQSEDYAGIVLVDCEPGDNVAVALTSRGVAATGAFTTASERAVLCFPYVMSYDEATNTSQPFPYSPFLAGVIAATDNDDTLGYWTSPSNKLIKGITALSTPVWASFRNKNSDTNQLNAIGITTVFNAAGKGFRTWGNRNASYPSSTAMNSFIVHRRIADVVHRSLEEASLQFSDLPISQALIDEVRQAGNNFMNTLIGRKAVYDGSRVEYNKDDNSSADLANGQIKFRIVFLGATPAEHITFLSTVDTSLFSSLS